MVVRESWKIKDKKVFGRVRVGIDLIYNNMSGKIIIKENKIVKGCKI